jgi:hypothetical protein
MNAAKTKSLPSDVVLGPSEKKCRHIACFEKTDNMDFPHYMEPPFAVLMRKIEGSGTQKNSRYQNQEEGAQGRGEALVSVSLLKQ